MCEDTVHVDFGYAHRQQIQQYVVFLLFGVIIQARNISIEFPIQTVRRAGTSQNMNGNDSKIITNYRRHKTNILAIFCRAGTNIKF